MNKEEWFSYFEDQVKKHITLYDVQRDGSFLNVSFTEDYAIQIPLDAIYDEIQHEDPINVTRRMISFLESFYSQNNKTNFEISHDQIIVVIRDLHVDHVLHDPLIDQNHPLHICYAIDNEDSIAYLSNGYLEKFDYTMDQLRKMAMENTKKMPIIEANDFSTFDFHLTDCDVNACLEFYQSDRVFNSQFLRGNFLLDKPSRTAIILFVNLFVTFVVYVPDEIAVDRLKDQIHQFMKDLYDEYHDEEKKFPFTLLLRKENHWSLFV